MRRSPLLVPLYTCLKISAFQHFSTSPVPGDLSALQFACAQKPLLMADKAAAAVLTSQGKAGAC